MQSLFGTRTTADINLIAQILMIVALWVGFYFAHTRQIPKHRNVQTTVVIVNIFLIAFVMLTSFYSFVILGGTTGGLVASLMILHGAFGLLAELTGIYLVLRMRTQLIPPRWRVKNFKLVMRALIVLWTLIVAGGLGIYYYRYLAPQTATVSSIARLQQAADDLAIHADEIQSAARRGNLATTKRHAEHLVNLAVGKTSGDHGDLDKNGSVEDPGDGTGALIYLQRVRDDAVKAGNTGAPAVALADQVRDAIIKIVASAKTVIQANDLQTIAPQIAESATLAEQISADRTNGVPRIAELLNAPTGLLAVTVENAPNAPNTVTVNIKDFEYLPKTLTIKKGTTVVFVNLDNSKHTVTADTRKFASSDLASGDKFTFTFDEAGTFPYYCEFHGDRGGVDMAGTIIVQ